MATPKKRTNREYRAGRCHHWLYLASVLFPILLFFCAGTAIGQESQQEAHREARVWLEFNHHLGGMVVLVLAGLTWLEMLGMGPAMAVRLAWPSCLILIGLYNVILSDRFAWPIGPSGLVESISNPEVLQHKILAIMVLTLGLIELLRRLERVTRTAWLYLFYVVAMLTGGILLMHDFGTASHMHPHDLTVSHVVMGLLALLALVLKVLVDRGILIGRSTHLYPLSLVGLGVQLLMFTESSGVER
jgi:copper resistance protein D